ncbi:MAG: immunoglobulin domain-containing protein [Phycisphaerales bacterium]
MNTSRGLACVLACAAAVAVRAAESNAQDCRTWKQLPIGGPSPRHGHKMVYDTQRNVIVLDGGAQRTDGAGQLGDHETWELVGGSWQLRATVFVPRPTGYNFGLAYDAARGVTVRHGGSSLPALSDASGIGNQLWEWNGSNWVQRTTFGSLSRAGHVMTYDPVRGRVVSYGGVFSGGFASGQELFEYDGAFWTRRAPSNTANVDAIGRVFSAVPQDVHSASFATVGGFNEYGDELVFTFVGQTSPSGSVYAVEVGPIDPARARYAAAVAGKPIAPAPLASETVMIGGIRANQILDEFLMFQSPFGPTPVSLQVPRPPARAFSAVAYDRLNDRYILFGGLGPNGVLGDTWEYSAASPLFIVSQPLPVVVLNGRQISLSVSAQSAAAVSYQWYRSGTPIDGATQATLVIPVSTFADTGEYTCTVSNGCQTLTSNAASVQVGEFCLMDFNRDSVVNPDDLGDFITLYFQTSEGECIAGP